MHWDTPGARGRGLCAQIYGETSLFADISARSAAQISRYPVTQRSEPPGLETCRWRARHYDSCPGRRVHTRSECLLDPSRRRSSIFPLRPSALDARSTDQWRPMTADTWRGGLKSAGSAMSTTLARPRAVSGFRTGALSAICRPDSLSTSTTPV